MMHKDKRKNRLSKGKKALENGTSIGWGVVNNRDKTHDNGLRHSNSHLHKEDIMMTSLPPDSPNNSNTSNKEGQNQVIQVSQKIHTSCKRHVLICPKNFDQADTSRHWEKS